MPEITPWRLTLGDYTPIVTPGEEPPVDVHTPEITPNFGSTTESADRDRRRLLRHIYSPPLPAPYIKKFAADTKAYSLITRSQLTTA